MRTGRGLPALVEGARPAATAVALLNVSALLWKS
jgi:hypothetical protein